MTNARLAAILEAVAAEAPLTPEAVVAAARPRAHPLHDEFEWDDKKAAHSHRLDVARTLIRRVRHGGATVTRRVVRVPAYVHDPAAPSGTAGYVALSGMRRDSDDARAVMDDELTRVVGALGRARAVAGHVGCEGLGERLARMLAEAESVRALVAAGALEARAS